jgi:galactonate dehydratase
MPCSLPGCESGQAANGKVQSARMDKHDRSTLASPARREWLGRTGALATSLALGPPAVLRAQSPLSLDFLTIPDPDGWHPSLRLKGDWLVVAISDGLHTGFGEASHSRDDAACRAAAERLFADHYAGFEPSLEALAKKEAELALLEPDFVTATALSSLNQALYELLAKREQVPVYQLFRDRPGVTSLPLYTTINRSLEERSRTEYLAIVSAVAEQGFASFKCAPFEAVDSPAGAVDKAAAGLAMLAAIRDRFPGLGMRVDFHERFSPESFAGILPALERLDLEWIEEPFAMGADFAALKAATALRVAAGELFWGRPRFARIVDNAWADVIMPDVKHVGGFGPLLDVMRMAEGRCEVSPHNPSGPISTAASLHAVAVRPDSARFLEYAFDKTGSRRATGEQVENGRLYLSDEPGWGVDPSSA